jgi:hypothetical protein
MKTDEFRGKWTVSETSEVIMSRKKKPGTLKTSRVSIPLNDLDTAEKIDAACEIMQPPTMAEMVRNQIASIVCAAVGALPKEFRIELIRGIRRAGNEFIVMRGPNKSRGALPDEYFIEEPVYLWDKRIKAAVVRRYPGDSDKNRAEIIRYALEAIARVRALRVALKSGDVLAVAHNMFHAKDAVELMRAYALDHLTAIGHELVKGGEESSPSKFDDKKKAEIIAEWVELKAATGKANARIDEKIAKKHGASGKTIQRLRMAANKM